MTPRRRGAARKTRPAQVREDPAAPYAAARLLLDTHVWLWWQADDRRLGALARRAIAHAPDVRLSVASVWEIAIKARLGKLVLPRNSNIRGELDHHGFEPLAVELAHAEAFMMVPAVHRDPFDRMLVAQAMVEGLTIVTADRELSRYDVPVMDAAR